MIQISLIASLAVIFLNILRWPLVEILTPFFEPFLELIVHGVFFVVLILSVVISLIKFLFRSDEDIFEILAPVAINAVALVVILFVPFTDISLEVDFEKNLTKRQEVVQMIQDNILVPNVPHNKNLIALGSSYEDLSAGGGEVLIEPTENGTNVFFYTFRGVTDNFSGFVYRLENDEPKDGDFGCQFVNSEKMEDHWYWISCS